MRRPRGTTRSSKYRVIDRSPNLRAFANALLELKRAHHAAEVATVDAYRHAMAWLGCDSDAAERALRATVGRCATKIATAAKKRQGAATADLVLALLDVGKRPVDVAREAHVSARHVRRIAEKRTYRCSAGPTKGSRGKTNMNTGKSRGKANAQHVRN